MVLADDLGYHELGCYGQKYIRTPHIDRIAAAFSVSFEQVCQRLTTLQRDGARGVPFFSLPAWFHLPS